MAASGANRWPMNSEPSSAIENGLTAQLMNSVTPTPRQCSRTWPSAPKSIFSSIGMIISQTSPATGRLTRAISALGNGGEQPGQQMPERDARDDAQRDPQREIAFEQIHVETSGRDWRGALSRLSRTAVTER